MLNIKGMEMTLVSASLAVFKHLRLVVPLSIYPSLKGQVRANGSYVVQHLRPLTLYYGSLVSHLAIV